VRACVRAYGGGGGEGPLEMVRGGDGMCAGHAKRRLRRGRDKRRLPVHAPDRGAGLVTLQCSISDHIKSVSELIASAPISLSLSMSEDR
jgi:hypothetical protein